MLLSGANEHPFRFEMVKGQVTQIVRAYIWNMSHGGGAKRPPNEYRIQITKVSQFKPEPAGVTLILGWSDAFGVFSAFDISHHARPLGASPSIQIGGGTLSQAGQDGVAAQEKGNHEVAVAIRPDRLATYIVHKDQAHTGDLAPLTPSAPDVDLASLASPERTHQFGSEAELAQRLTVLERIAALEREIEAIKPQLGMIGHNRPPEAIGPDAEILAGEINSAATAIRAEMAEIQPDPMTVARGAGVLQRIWRMLLSARDEAGKFAGTIKDKGREKAAEIVVGTVAGTGAIYGKQIIGALQSAVNAISQWFHLIL